MALLILNFGDGEVPLELPAHGSVTIGSAVGADVYIDHPDVEPRHAGITVDHVGDCWIRDFASNQGTFVNGQRVEFQKLAPGDDLMFGLVVVRFVKLLPNATLPLPGVMTASPALSSESSLGQAGNEPARGAVSDEAKSQAPASTASPAPQSAPLLKPGTRSNQSRFGYLLRLFFLLAAANAVFFFTCAFWFYYKTRSEFDQKFKTLSESLHPAAPAVPAAPSSSDIAVSRLSNDAEELKKQNAALRSTLNDLQKKLSATDASTAESSRQLAGLAATVDEIKKAAAKKDPAPVIQGTAEGAPSDSQKELVLLKERNRLTAYADEAIATGARDPYERLWEAIEDPRLANLVHAARAEILRVQDCYINGQRVKFYGIQQHQIPVAEIFPDSAALAPAQLSDDQLIQVLQDLKQSWQTRVKAAWHLGQRRSTKVGDALIKAIKTDPMLDVAAEATFSFEQITGYHAKLFEVQPIEVWWKSYNEKPPSNKIISKTPNDAGADSSAKAE